MFPRAASRPVRGPGLLAARGVNIENAVAFQAPDTPGVQFHDLLTVFVNGSGGIEPVINGSGGIKPVINGTGGAVDSGFGGPSDVVSYP